MIHIRQIQKSSVHELHICEECAQEKGLIKEEESELSISNLLSGLIEGKESLGAEETVESCPRCGTKAAEFRKRGKLGCPSCFEAFQKDVRSILSQMAGRTRHVGKLPQSETPKEDSGPDRESLAIELRDAIEREDYESAALLRDRIRELETNA